MEVNTEVSTRPAAESPVEREALAAFRSEYGTVRLGPVVVVIPAYNEAGSIEGVLRGVPDEVDGLRTDALVMSDGSTDGTPDLARAHDAYVCAFPTNRGQGVALRQGYRLARELGADYIVTIDADGQYDSSDIPVVAKPVVADQADFAIGSRRLGWAENDDFVRHVGVTVFAWMISLLTGTRLTDTSSGLRAFKASMSASVTLTQPQYQTSELLIGALVRGYRVVELPATMRRRTSGQTRKGKNLPYGLRYCRVILGTWYRERWSLRKEQKATRRREPESSTPEAMR